MSITQPVEFRKFDDPRRHVPHLAYKNHKWVLSVRDYANNHHERGYDTWAEALHSANHWVHVNAAHGCTVYESDNFWEEAA